MKAKKLIAFAAGALFLAAASRADFNAPGGVTFEGGMSDYARGIAVDTITAGGPYIYVAGFNNQSAMMEDYLLLKYDGNGNFLSSATYTNDAAGNGGDYAGGVAVDRNGNVYVTGYSRSSEGYNDYFTIKYTSNLVVITSAAFHAPGAYDHYANAIAIDGNGNVFVGGSYTEGGMGNYNYLIVKYDSNLVFVSSAAYDYWDSDNVGNDTIALAVDASNNIIMTGTSFNGNWDRVTIKYDNMLSQTPLAFKSAYPGENDYNYAVAVDTYGNIVTAGELWTGSSDEFLLTKYSSDLSVTLATASFSPGGSSIARGILVDKYTGSVFVTGKGGNTGGDWYTVKFTTSLQRIAVKTYDSGLNDAPYAIAQGTASWIYVAGNDNSAGTHIRLIRYDTQADFVSDVTAPAQVTNLSASVAQAYGPNMSGVKLTWSMPGDDGWSTALSTGSMFAVQYSTSNDNWNVSSPFTMVMATNSITPGTAVSYSMTWFQPNRLYYFKVWHMDEQGNWSQPSNTISFVTQVVTGDPANIYFAGGGMTVQKDVKSSAIRLNVYDNNWNLTAATAPISVFLSGRLTTYIGEEYEIDSTAVFYDTNNAVVTSLAIPAGASGIDFFYKTSVSPYTVIQVTYTINGIAATQNAWPSVVNSGIMNAKVHTGNYTSNTSVTMSPNQSAYIDFELGEYTSWRVLVSTSPDRANYIWQYNGWGMPSPGQVIWNGNYDYYDTQSYIWRSEKAPKGTYYVRIQLGWSGGIVDDLLSVTLDSQEIFGRVTDAAGNPLTDVFINAYGASMGYTQTDSTGNYRISGLTSGYYNVNFMKMGYSPLNVSAEPGLLNAVLNKPAYIMLNAQREPSSDPSVPDPERTCTVYLNDSGYTKYYAGSLHFDVNVTTSDNELYIDTTTPKYQIDNSTDNIYTGGKWTVLEVEPGTYSLNAYMDGYTSINTSTAVVSGQTIKISTLSFARKKSVWGTVGLPSSSPSDLYVSVQAIPQTQGNTECWGSAIITAGTTLSTYTIYGLDTGIYTLKLWVPGYAKSTVSVNMNSSVVQASPLTLAEGGTLSGTLTIEGDSGPDAYNSLYINAWSPDAYSYGWTSVEIASSPVSASAAYTIKGLDDGTYWANTYLNGYELVGAVGWNGVKGAVSGGTGTLNLTMRKYSGAIQAKITAPGGDYANVLVSLHGGTFWNSFWSGQGIAPAAAQDSGGSFSPGTGILTTPKLGTGSYQITAVYTPTGMTKTKSVMVSNGQVRSVDLDLSANTYSISGTVSLSKTNPPSGISDMQTLVDTAPVYNTASVKINEAWVSTTSYRVFAADYSKIDNMNYTDTSFKSGVINGDGTYSIGGLIPGVYILRIPALELDGVWDNGKEVAPTEQRVVVAASNVTANPESSKGYTVSGQLKLPAALSADRSFWIYVFKASKFTVSNYSGAEAWTNMLGSVQVAFSAGSSAASYSVKGLAPGSYVLAVKDWGGATERQYANASIVVKVESSDLNGQNIQMSKGGKIVFKLRDADSGVMITPQNMNSVLPNTYNITAIASPWIDGGWGQIYNTGAGGGASDSFSMTFLPEASYDVTFGQSSYGYMTAAAGVSTGGNKTNYAAKTMTGVKVKNGQSADLGTIDIKQGLTITGTVSDSSGNGIPNIPVVAIPAMTNQWNSQLRGFTDISGNYSIVGLDTDTKYYDVIACPRVDPTLFGGYFYFGAGGINYGEKVRSMVKISPNLAVDFVLSQANGAISGKVVTEDGGELQNPDDTNLPTAKIYLQPEDSMPRTNPIGDITADTAIDGTFSIEALSPGDYRLFVLSGGYASYSKTVTIGSSELSAGTITLRRGAKLSGAIKKDGLVDGKPQYPSTSEVKSIIAATDDLSAMLIGSLKLSGDKTVAGYEINGFQPLNSYNIMFTGEDDELLVAVKDNQSVIGYTVPYSTYSATGFDLTFRITAPAVFSRARKTAANTYAVVFDLTGALRKTIPADDDLAQILTLTAGSGALSGQYMTPDRKSLSCVYTAPAGEKQFSIRLHAYSKAVDQASGSEFELSETLQYLTGIGASNKVKVSNIRGGKITLDGDSSSVMFGPGTFDVASSTVTVFITFTRADSLSELLSAPAKGPSRFAIPRSEGSYHDRTYKAMKLAQSASVEPFSSFYDVLLPAGIARMLKKDATLSLQYSSGVDPNTLNVYYYDDKNNVYLIESSNKKIDKDTSIISVTVKHASTYVLLQSNAAVIQGNAYDGPLFVYNFPNPFDLKAKTATLGYASMTGQGITGTMIHYGMPTTLSGEVEIRIYDVAGQLVRTISDGARTGGAHYYTEWDGKNDAGKNVASGVYIARFSVDKKNEKFFKMAVIK